MQSQLRSYSLGACLFVFLFVVVGAGLHLNPMGAFVAALSGTPLVIHAANRGVECGQERRRGAKCKEREGKKGSR